MIVYRASELGSCTRRLVLARVGYEPKATPEKFVEIFARGNETEQEVKDELISDYGWDIDREQDEVVFPITNEIQIVGHLDGVGLSPTNPQPRVLEIKRMAPLYWNEFVAKGWETPGLVQKYKWQLSSYMIATGLEGVLVAKNGETGELHFVYVEEPFYKPNDLRARVLVIEGRARSFATLDDLGECDRVDYPCPFFYTHLEEDREVDESGEVEVLAGVYLAARDRERVAKMDAEKARDDIGRLLGDRNRISSGRAKVTRYTTSRRRFDRDRAIRDGVAVTKYETVTEGSAVKITVRKEDE